MRVSLEHVVSIQRSVNLILSAFIAKSISVCVFSSSKTITTLYAARGQFRRRKIIGGIIKINVFRLRKVEVPVNFGGDVGTPHFYHS